MGQVKNDEHYHNITELKAGDKKEVKNSKGFIVHSIDEATGDVRRKGRDIKI